MTPPAAATVAGRSHARRPVRSASPRVARRVSGPARTPVRGGSVALPAGSVLAPPLGLRLARRAAALPDARLLDRLIRGRLWIGLLAVGLIGIVFMQISLLKLNTGIGRAVQTAQTLDQQNASMRAELSRMAGGERVQDAAKAMGFTVPAVGQPAFLDAARVSATRAATAITKPAPIQQLPLGMIPPAQGGTAGVTPAPVTTASGVPTTTTTAPGATAPVVPTAPVSPAPTTASAPAPTATAATAPAPVQQTQAPVAPASSPPATASSGGGVAAPVG